MTFEIFGSHNVEREPGECNTHLTHSRQEKQDNQRVNCLMSLKEEMVKIRTKKDGKVSKVTSSEKRQENHDRARLDKTCHTKIAITFHPLWKRLIIIEYISIYVLFVKIK